MVAEIYFLGTNVICLYFDFSVPVSAVYFDFIGQNHSMQILLYVLAGI